MNGIVVAVAIMVSSTTAPPVTFDFDLPPDALRPRYELLRPAATPKRAPVIAKRHSTADRIIAVVAGGTLGFVAGGTIGAYIAGNRDNPDDDISALRGVVVGAPIGAAVGAFLGYRLTK
jgi:hypothetical protein